MTRFARSLAALALAAGLVGAGAAGAAAIPADGPGPETPGTSSRVWPTTVRAGDVLNFEVSGYPANETVYIKIDDGLMCSDTSHGACVYHTQALDANGYASGSIVVPNNLAPGPHWLRMLATGDVFDSQTGKKLGYQGYTRRGGNDFTVVTGGGGAGAGGGNAEGAGGTAAEGGAELRSDGTLEGGSVSLDVGDDEKDAKDKKGKKTESMDDVTENVSKDSQGSAARNAPGAAQRLDAEVSQFPVLGASVLGGSVLLGGGALTWALLRGRTRGGTAEPAGPSAPE